MHELCCAVIIILVVLAIYMYLNKDHFLSGPIYLGPGKVAVQEYQGGRIVVTQTTGGNLCVDIITKIAGNFRWCSGLVAESGQQIGSYWDPVRKEVLQYIMGNPSIFTRSATFDHIAIQMLRDRGLDTQNMRNILVAVMQMVR